MADQKPSAPQLEDAYLLDQVVDEYQRRGYRVTLGVDAQDLPDPLRHLRPSLLASRGDDRVAVIVKTGRPSAVLRTDSDIEAIRAEGWRVEFNFADDPVPPIAAPDAVRARLREAMQIADGNHKEAALLFVWAAVEEALRGLASRFAPHETGRRVLPPDQAYSIGLLGGSQHRLFSSLQRLRNQSVNNITPISIPDHLISDTANLVERMSSPAYIPPPIIANHVFAQIDPTQDILEQIRRAFPHSDPADRTDAGELIKALQISNKK